MNKSNTKKVVGEEYFEELTHANEFFLEISEASLLFYWLTDQICWIWGGVNVCFFFLQIIAVNITL